MLRSFQNFIYLNFVSGSKQSKILSGSKIDELVRYLCKNTHRKNMKLQKILLYILEKKLKKYYFLKLENIDYVCSMTNNRMNVELLMWLSSLYYPSLWLNINYTSALTLISNKWEIKPSFISEINWFISGNIKWDSLFIVCQN